MSETLPIIRLTPCPKGYTKDLAKAVSPAQTIAHVRERLAAAGDGDERAALERAVRFGLAALEHGEEPMA